MFPLLLAELRLYVERVEWPGVEEEDDDDEWYLGSVYDKQS